jgi:hypothetical protein
LLSVIILACVLFLAGQSTCLAVTVTLQWGTSEGSTGYKVYYRADSSVLPFLGTGATEGTSPINVFDQTNATISGLDPAHSYYFAVTAYDAAGVESSYSNTVSVPELLSPTISLTSPANNETVSGTVSVNATASDNVGVTSVGFYVNGELKSTDTSTPYLYSWNTTSLAAGNYTLMAKANDAAGNVGQSADVTVTVVNDIIVPTVAVTSPPNNATVSGSTTISANAVDNLGVTKVEFYVNGLLLAATNVAPYSYNWNTALFANVPYTLTAKAYDATGNVGQSSNLNVIVSNNLSPTHGDINGDGKVDIADALMALNFAVDLIQASPDQLSRGDVSPIVNGIATPDGMLDIQDALMILRAAVGLASL